jgi:hypothetical protein
MDIDKSHSNHENELTAMEARLAAWRPAAVALNRDRMLFNAGRAAAKAEGRSRLWQLVTAASVLVTVTLSGLLAHERSQRVALESKIPAPTERRDPEPSTNALVQLAKFEPPGPNSYLALTSQLAKGARDLSWLDVERETGPRSSPPPASSKSTPNLQPLRPTDLERVLDL